MWSCTSEFIPQMENSVPQTLQAGSQNQNQNNYYFVDSSPSSEQSTLKPTKNESPRATPKHSPRVPHKKEFPRNEHARDPSPMQLEKPDFDQKDALSRSCDSIQPSELNLSISHESNNKDRKESRGSDRSKKKSSWYSVFYSTYKSRSDELRRYFKCLPSEERLIGDYSCALQREILVQGRLYLTQNYLCFYANIFGWETCVCIKWTEVSAMVKQKTAILIPNAILIVTDSEKYFFTTFSARDKAFMVFFRLWQNSLMNNTMSTQEVWEWVHTVYGEELGLTSDDDDYIPPAPGFDKIYPIVRLPESLSEQQVFGGGGGGGGAVEKVGCELASSATDSTNKSQGSVPSQNLEVDGMPTDMSDNSSESDAQPIISEKVLTSCTNPHDGRHVISVILPMHIDKLFTLMFTNSNFFYEFYDMRQSSDIRASSWQKSANSKEKVRTISMVINLNQPLAPKSANVQQTQVMLPCSVSGHFYAIDDEIVNNGIPYADSFYILMHYCLEKINEKETSLNIYSHIKYKKSVWSFVKNIIEKTTWSNVQEHNEALVKALLAECEESKVRRTRRRNRAMSNKPVIVPVDHMPASSRKNTFASVSRAVETDKRMHLLFLVGLVFLFFLLIINFLLLYKFWELKDFMEVAKFGYWQADMEILKNPPKNHEEWLQVLRVQENLHRIEVEKWQKTLQSTVDLLKKAEESFHGLKGSLAPSYEEVLFRKDKQEL